MPAESLRRRATPEIEQPVPEQSPRLKRVLTYDDLDENAKEAINFNTEFVGRDLDRMEKIGDRYVKKTRIGEGGMGEAWTVIDKETGRLRVAKTMHANLQIYEHAVKRFFREMRALAKIKNPFVVPVHDVVFVDPEKAAQRRKQKRKAA